MAELTLRVITPDRILLDKRVSSVVVPGVDGKIGILPRHAPMVAALDVGELQYVENGQEQELFVSEGFAEVRGETLRVVCEAGELPEEIDESRAQDAERRARERIREGRTPGGVSAVDLARAEASLRRALMRMRLRGKQRR